MRLSSIAEFMTMGRIAAFANLMACFPTSSSSCSCDMAGLCKFIHILRHESKIVFIIRTRMLTTLVMVFVQRLVWKIMPIWGGCFLWKNKISQSFLTTERPVIHYYNLYRSSQVIQCVKSTSQVIYSIYNPDNK